ncbi:MAG: M20/M25/M40 family metallo-hydrolase, partial [Meiothermus sp.]|nr:M20/M25/M40 family metallo-hydrolase [Meiothermus sp.]
MSWKDYLTLHQAAHLEDFRTFLSIPSISAQPAHRDDVRRAAEWLAARFKQAGFLQAEVLPTAGHPVVLAEYCPYPDKPTMLFYGHYDVQPADNPERWNSPPFEPTVVDGRIVARGASDMKGQVMAFLLAAEALIATGQLQLNVKALIEGEEEISSPSLPAFIEQHRERLRCDMIINGDSGQLSETVPLLGLGVRGICGLEFDLTGPAHDLHSGTWGGQVQNPLHAMAEQAAQLVFGGDDRHRHARFAGARQDRRRRQPLRVVHHLLAPAVG